MELTPQEQKKVAEIAKKVRDLREYFARFDLPEGTVHLKGWYEFLNGIKIVSGNLDADQSFVATLLAKQFLLGQHGGLAFDAAAKSQAAPGLDIDATTNDGKRIVGEVKTVFPYQVQDFGSQQRKSIMTDLEKLATARADFKYMFVSEIQTFEVLVRKYGKRLEGINLVLLVNGKEFSG